MTVTAVIGAAFFVGYVVGALVSIVACWAFE
jgi:hypothetical protein